MRQGEGRNDKGSHDRRPGRQTSASVGNPDESMSVNPFSELSPAALRRAAEILEELDADRKARHLPDLGPYALRRVARLAQDFADLDELRLTMDPLMKPIAEREKALRKAITEAETFLWATGAKSPTGAVLKAAAAAEKAEEEPGEFGADDGPPRKLKLV
jgi:hypothetical protein